MKRTKRLLSLLLVLVFLVGLFPVSALAEEESPAFTVQPASGSHAPGESYALAWALNQRPDSLELVREATEEERANQGLGPCDEAPLVLVLDLDPESTSLELSAPEEFTVFYLRAFFGELELLSEAFTVTEETPDVEDAVPCDAPVGDPQTGDEDDGRMVSAPADETEASRNEGMTPSFAGEDIAPEGAPQDNGDEPAAEPVEPVPDEPQDDTHYFTIQPQNGSVDPEGSYHVSWRTNFTPTKVEIIQYTGYGGYKVLDTLTSGLSTSMGYDITYEVAFAAAKANGLIDHGFGVWAYYTNSDKVFSEDFYVHVTPLDFTTQPSGGTINQGGTLLLSWRTNFRPLSIEIQYNYSQGWKTCYEMPYSQANIYSNSYTLSYGDAVTGTWRILAYYGDGISDYVSSNEFFITCTGYSFTQSPSGGTVVPEGSLTLSWKTDFTPTKIQIGFMQTAGTPGSSGTFLPQVTLSSDLAKEMSRTLPYDTLESSSTWYIAAWYGENKLVYSAPINISITRRSFSQSPEGGSVEPNSSLALSWKTNFTPTRIEIRYYREWLYFNTSEWELRKTIDTDLARQMSYPLSYDESITGTWAIWAYYGEQLYVSSETFSIQRVDYSVTKPEDISIAPGETEMLRWESNFVPKKVEIYRVVPGGFQDTTYLVDTLSFDLSSSMSYPVTYNTDYAANQLGAQKWYLKLWWGDGYYDYKTSGFFHVNLIERAFTASPSGGTVILGNYLTLRWETNFTPVRVELGYLNGDHWVKKAAIGAGFAREMSYQLTYYEAYTSDAWRVRAFYGTGNNDFVTSEAYSVNKRELTFSAIPTSGYIYPWTTRLLQWTTDFEPVRVEIGYLNGDSWVLVCTVTSDLQMSMKYTLDYAHAATSDNWRIRAFYGSESNEYLQSGSFSIEQRSAYVCGDNLTATFSGGVLTFNGSGAMYDFNGEETPWKGIRSSITKVVIPEGVTTIGKAAFYLCFNLTEVTIPSSVTVIGSSAFSACMALKTVKYGGLRAQWNDVSVAASNEYLTRATFSYLYKTGGIYGSNLGYILDGERNLLIITGNGDGPTQAGSPWLNWAPYIQTIKVEGASSIWDEAFRECTGVTKVYLPESLTLVGDRAFNDCTEITDVYYEGNIYAWDEITIRPYNDPLTDATLHTAPHQEQLTGDLSWSVNDEGLLRIWIDDDLMGDGEDTNIPDFASYSDAPWYAEYHDRITSLCIEEGVTGIGKNAFRNLQELYSVDIAESVTYIGNTAFYNCSMLQETLALPNGIESIGANAFTNCTNTEILILPDSVTTISAGAFRGCSALYKVVLPAHLLEIPENCFLNCTRLESIEIPATVTTIGSYAFNDCYALARQRGSVYYGGTSVQWNDIDIKNNNSYLLSAAAYHFTPEELAVNAANFPDATLRGYIADEFNTDGVKVNSVAYLSDAEIAAATAVDIDDNGDVTGLEGIEYLTALRSVTVKEAPSLTTADLRANTELYYVQLSSCGLTELELDGLTDLQYLYVGGNQLTGVDLEGLANLRFMRVSDNPLTELDISGISPEVLYCENTSLTELVLDQQPKLHILHCYGTGITELDLVGCPLLAETLQTGNRSDKGSYWQYYKSINGIVCYLCVDKTTICYADHDGLPIDEAHFPDPQFRLYVSLHFDLNRSGTLSAAEIAAAKEINDEDNDYWSLRGIEYLTNLEKIVIDAAPGLTGVDLRANTRLTFVDFSSCGNLAELHVEGLSALQYLFVDGNRLTELDLTGVTNLKNLLVNGNPLSALDLGEQPELYRLSCFGTQIAALDLRGCPKLLSAVVSGARTETADFVQYLLGYTTGWLKVDKDTELVGLNGIPVDAEHFPDPNFRGYVSANFDTNHSGWLTEEEIAEAETIYCAASDIETLQGIEYFPELLVLACDDNLLTELDLSANTKLTELDCSYNELTQLSLTGLTALTKLSCEGNPLTELNLSAQKLTHLYCHGTSLSALDLSGQTELRILSCYGTDIETLDLSSCPWLQTAATEGERTERADYAQYKFSSAAILRVNKDTQLLGIDGIRIDEANFPDPVFRAYVAENFDTSRNGYLDDAELAAITQIEVDCMGIESLQGIEYFSMLTSLACADNALTVLDLSSNTRLVSLQCYDNQLSELDLSANTELGYVDCDDNPDLAVLNLSTLTQLAYLDVSGCCLTSLDLSATSSLYYMECDSNALTSLILGEQPELASLICYANDLTELDISGCPILADAWLNGTHEVQSWGLKVSGGTLGGYMELDNDLNVIDGSTPDHIPGDVNGDGVVNNKDVTRLMRYLKDPTMQVNAAALDVNGDGKVTNKDVTRLVRYLKHHDVDIF